jgi:hypothetical protein
VEPRQEAGLLPEGRLEARAFGFWHGASIDDPSGRLETTGSVMAHTKLRSLGDVDEGLFASWLGQARKLELSSDA